MPITCLKCSCYFRCRPKVTTRLFCDGCAVWMKEHSLNYCSRCSRFRSTEDFSSEGQWCRNCRQNYNLSYRKAKPKSKVKDPAAWQRWTLKRLHNIRARARKTGIPCTITEEHLIDAIPLDKRCPILGLDLEFRPSLKSERNRWASIDRIVPSKGYVPGNIRVISFLANRLKSDATADQILAVGHDLKRIEALLAA